MKRLTALFLSLALILCLIPAASADSTGYSYYACTSLEDVSESGLNNIRLVAESVNGLILEPGEYFSFNQLVGPRTREQGFETALNGRGVKVVGGGVAIGALHILHIGAGVILPDCGNQPFKLLLYRHACPPRFPPSSFSRRARR